jgi:hypothetical protein
MKLTRCTAYVVLLLLPLAVPAAKDCTGFSASYERANARKDRKLQLAMERERLDIERERLAIEKARAKITCRLDGNTLTCNDKPCVRDGDAFVC